jgi:UPF0716 protein FxsA|tara:strand:+ start:745 stop:1161 length:417 start_codon:yes stop_codon:yes gene_type:complete
MKYLLTTFIFLPILEMYVLIKVGGNIGAFSTIILVVTTALIGVFLLRIQGFMTIFNIRNKLNNAELPTQEIFTGIFLALGGFLLLIPGFVTDILGFLCLLPFTRNIILAKIYREIQFPDSNNSSQNADWIEGEYKKDK